jgi:serine/threonine protein kinase
MTRDTQFLSILDLVRCETLKELVLSSCDSVTQTLLKFSAKYVPAKTFTFCGSPMLMAPEIIRCIGHDKGVDHWSWAVTVYHMVTGKYPFYEQGMDELALYKRICKGAFELTGLMSIEFRLLMVAMLYPDPSQRLGSRASGWRDILASPWFADDPCLDLTKLRSQTPPAPWIPDVKDALDVSQFHNDSSVDDLMNDENCPSIPDDRQSFFCSFGPRIASRFSRCSS